MAELKSVEGDRKLVEVGSACPIKVRLEGATEGPVAVEFSSRSEQVTIDPTQLTLEDGAVGEVQVVISEGDRKYTVEARLAGAGEEDPKTTFTIRALDPGEHSLAAAANLIRDLGQLGYITDEAFSRRLTEELRATGQAVKNVQDKLRAREETIGDPEVRELLAGRLERLHGRRT
jgi:hypothetical protein